ncbi:lactosylceramide 4-alpha-galactosyltransferase-like isoform X2 [Homarus americanus]|uniref:lactosylceramide 4-alpha-galactosyltransferase-like isoform X2 n=1 Tax=Homarus americanus TaxID=6706 RepID=UPI001C46ADDA|nr:lactosylceramide 4-alpha-galactosyltransferase-like isoform X2 [Homarus americanus]
MRQWRRYIALRVAGAFILLVCLLYTSRPPEGKRPPPPSPSQGDVQVDKDEQVNDPLSFCRTPSGPQTPHQHFLKLVDIFSLKEAQQEGVNNILLVESSCAVNPNLRVWCALESLARQNPQAVVWYVMTSQVVDLRQVVAGRLLEHYHNLRVVTVDLRQVFYNTPLMDLYTSTAWNHNTSWPEINLADLMRLGLVWHLGGFYVDTDVVCIRSLASLTNVIGWQERSTLGSGVFHFDSHHPVLRRVMEYAAETFKTNRWGASGPVALTHVMKAVCEKEVLVTGAATRCHGVTLLPIRAFYPVPAPVWKTLFTRQTPRDLTMDRDDHLLHPATSHNQVLSSYNQLLIV